jgi:two-component system, NarL family, sensor kinase
MQSTHYNLVLFILASAFLILLMAGFIVTILFLYKRKQLAYFQTIEGLKLDYEKNLLHTQLEIQEQTLQHIAREIHDNINLSLTLVKLNLNTFDWDHPARAKNQIDSSLQQISKAITDLANISKGMNSELITNQGLIEVLNKETTRLKELDLFELSYHISGSPVFMDSQKELVIFRIIQEAFNNIIKHAKATLVKLNLEYNTDHINVFITDNGKGFCKQEVEQNKSKESKAGLSNMQKRAMLFNGETIIDSAIGAGTSIHITIPY